MTILAAVVPLQTAKPVTGWLGRAAQAWLLQEIKKHDQALSEQLHEGLQARRPYTIYVSPYVSSQRLRITSMDAALSALLREKLLPNLQTLLLAGIEFKADVSQIEIEPTDFETLARTAFNGESISRLAFEFISPTAFHSGLLTIPLPLPALLFGSLIQAWNTFSPVILPVTLQDFVEPFVGVSKHHLKTRMVKLSAKERHIGFTGTTEYMVVPQAKTNFSADEYRLRVQTIYLLSCFAPYAGVGIRTTVGMGQIALLPSRTNGVS